METIQSKIFIFFAFVILFRNAQGQELRSFDDDLMLSESEYVSILKFEHSNLKPISISFQNAMSYSYFILYKDTNSFFLACYFKNNILTLGFRKPAIINTLNDSLLVYEYDKKRKVSYFKQTEDSDTLKVEVTNSISPKVRSIIIKSNSEFIREDFILDETVYSWSIYQNKLPPENIVNQKQIKEILRHLRKGVSFYKKTKDVTYSNAEYFYTYLRDIQKTK